VVVSLLVDPHHVFLWGCINKQDISFDVANKEQQIKARRASLAHSLFSKGIIQPLLS